MKVSNHSVTFTKFLLVWTALLCMKAQAGPESESSSGQREPRYRPRRSDVLVYENDGRVVGGVEAQKHEFPFNIASHKYSCGASLIRRNWALSAAHCAMYHSPDGRELRGGWHGLDETEPGEETTIIVGHVIHPEWDEPLHNNDIMLLRLDPPFNLSETIQVIQLPPRDYADLDCAWVTSPWNHGYGTRAWKLRKVDVPVISHEKCVECYPDLTIPINKTTMLCAGYDEGGKDACNGDSGGPLSVFKDGKHMQVGIVSWGLRPCAQPKRPGGYTRVSNYIDWIEETIRKEDEKAASGR